MSKSEALQVVQRASARAVTAVHGDMKQGLDSLATIAATAPLLGVFASVFGIVKSFPGISGEQWYIRAVIFDRLSQALMPIALSVIVALPALLCYKYLLAEVEAFDSEMENASLDLVNNLSRLAVH